MNKAVQDAAYYIWLKRGHPEGQDMEIWLEAKRQSFNLQVAPMSMEEDLSVKIVHEAPITELIHNIPEFSCIKTLSINEDDAICWNMEGEEVYCIQAMFIGKTGYGKSTTLNNICGQELFKTDDIKSCTKTLFSAEYKIHSKKNHFFSLCDLPGIGESIQTDKIYTEYYDSMIEKSHCCVYVLRADQRDYSKDLEIIKPMLKNKKQKKKLMLAINFADKIEPISRVTPFIPNVQQNENMKKKLVEIQKIFGIPKHKIIFYSATEGYNLEIISKCIVNILKSTVQTEPSYKERQMAIYKMTSQDNCGECGCINCMQFAMKAASPKNSMELSDCPYIDEDEAEEFYNSLKREQKPWGKQSTVAKSSKKIVKNDKKPSVKASNLIDEIKLRHQQIIQETLERCEIWK
jgi:small GTP-binding protein